MEGASVATALGYEQKVLKAISAPIRLEVMRILEGKVASPNQIRKELNKPLGLIAHHVRVLEECDCIELVEEKQVRGSTEHFYRPKMRSTVSDAVSAILPQPIREEVTDTLLGNIFKRIDKAIRSGTMDRRSDRHISWMQFELDQQGWDEFIALKAEQLDKEMALQASAAQRLSEESGQSLTVFTCNFGIELPSGECTESEEAC